VNDLRGRLDRLADPGAEVVGVTRSDEASAGPTRRWWRSGPALAAAAALMVAAAIMAALVVGRDGDDDVAFGDGDEAPGGGTGDSVVAVTYDASTLTRPWRLQLRFLDAEGTVVAERALNDDAELEDGSGDVMFGSVGTQRGVIEHVPMATCDSRRRLRDRSPPARAPSRSPRLPAAG
jgi:hypothetical protein